MNKQTNRRGEEWSLSLPSSAAVGRACGMGLLPGTTVCVCVFVICFPGGRGGHLRYKGAFPSSGGTVQHGTARHATTHGPYRSQSCRLVTIHTVLHDGNEAGVKKDEAGGVKGGGGTPFLFSPFLWSL